MRSRNRALVALVAGLLLLAGCAAPDNPQVVTPTDAGPAVSTVVVDPGAVAKEPGTPQTGEGKPSSDADVPGNGAVPDIPPTAVEQQIIISGLGGQVAYAVSGHNPGRFTPQQSAAIAVAEAEHPSGINWSGMCEGFAGSYTSGLSSDGWASARDAYYGTPHRHQMTSTTDARVGAVLRWPNGPYGHAVDYVGGGKVATTDFVRQGMVDIVSLRTISDAWFGGQLPSAFDPVEFPVGYGSNGLRAPVLAATAPQALRWPLQPGHEYARLVALKTRLGWGNRTTHFGADMSRWVVRWKKAQHWPTSSPVIGAQVYSLMLR